MRALWQMPELQEIWNHIETGETPVTVTGLSPVHRAQLAAALRLRSGRPLQSISSGRRRTSPVSRGRSRWFCRAASGSCAPWRR
mgnify:CR=1 FL=1